MRTMRRIFGAICMKFVGETVITGPGAGTGEAQGLLLILTKD